MSRVHTQYLLCDESEVCDVHLTVISLILKHTFVIHGTVNMFKLCMCLSALLGLHLVDLCALWAKLSIFVALWFTTQCCIIVLMNRKKSWCDVVFYSNILFADIKSPVWVLSMILYLGYSCNNCHWLPCHSLINISSFLYFSYLVLLTCVVWLSSKLSKQPLDACYSLCICAFFKSEHIHNTRVCPYNKGYE